MSKRVANIAIIEEWIDSHLYQPYSCFFSISLNNTTPPMTQVGHHTGHTTKEVTRLVSAQVGTQAHVR